jgi:hypothetical protein
VLARQRLVVHFVAEKGLRMQSGLHIERFVVIVGTFHVDIPRVQIRANHLKEIGKPGTTETADNIPALDADVPSVLADARKRLNLRELVISRFLDRSGNGKRPAIKIDARIVDVIVVDGKTC